MYKRKAEKSCKQKSLSWTHGVCNFEVFDMRQQRSTSLSSVLVAGQTNIHIYKYIYIHFLEKKKKKTFKKRIVFQNSWLENFSLAMTSDYALHHAVSLRQDAMREFKFNPKCVSSLGISTIVRSVGSAPSTVSTG